MTTSLQDRDAINATARAASRRLWVKLHELIKDPPITGGERPVLSAIQEYLFVLDRVRQTSNLNPYPDIANCLHRAGADEAAATFQLMAATFNHHRGQCLGHQVTISGTRRGDVLIGTDHADVIRGFRHQDLIIGGKGNDIICGNRGGDTINAGTGRDRVDGGRAVDACLEAESRSRCER
jgi:hypothetical protein